MAASSRNNVSPLFQGPLLLALGATFLQQTFVSIGRTVPAVTAPEIIADLRIDPAFIGVYFGISAAAALIGQLGCGSFIIRHGALRMSQIALVMIAIGMALMAAGIPAVFAISAIIAGAGGAVSTPASSHLLGRVAPPKQAPLVFSLKQTAVPAGLLLAGSLAPALSALIGWRGAVLCAAAGAAIFAVMLQPLRARFDDDRVPTQLFRVSDFGRTLKSVLGVRELRAMSWACLAFNGVQQVFTAYFVIYLTHLNYSLVEAGFMFSAVVSIAVPGRILWGWVGSFHLSPRLVMAGLALGMSGSVAVTGLFGADWPAWLIGVVAGGVSITALSWHGILLSETARAAPEGMRGAVTGGVLSFGQFGALSMPLIFSGLLSLTGSYGIGFIACAIPPLFAGIALLRQRDSPRVQRSRKARTT